MRASAILVAATVTLIGSTGFVEAQREPPGRVESSGPPPPGSERPPSGAGGADAAAPDNTPFLLNLPGPPLACKPEVKILKPTGFGGALPGVPAWVLIVTNIGSVALHPGTNIALSAGTWSSSVQLGGQLVPGGTFEVADLTLGQPFPYGNTNLTSCTAIVL